jgi:tripartite ATP-independent transporter DctP family solute receptor
MLKKMLLIVGLCSFMVMSLFVNTSLVKASEPIIFRVGNGDPPVLKVGKNKEIEHQSYSCMGAFKKSLEKLSKGRIKVEIYPYGRMGNNKSLIEQMLAGISGGAIGADPSDGLLSSFYKDIQVFSIPYIFSSKEQAYAVLDSKIGKQLFDDMAKKSGLRVLSVAVNGGFRGFTNNKRPVKTADDMKGLKIRTIESGIYMEMVKALGATPTPISWTEVYSALQTGVVDGQENSAFTMVAGSLQEVQKYYTLNNHILGILYFVTSERWLRSLPKDLQTAVIKAGVEAQKAARMAVVRNEKICLDFLKKSGVKVYVPKEKEIQTFKKVQEPVIKYLKSNLDNPEWVDKVLAAAEAAAK